MNRLELQTLAEDRTLDAGFLLSGGRWSAAGYLAGYAVECGLKACILARIGANPAIVFEDSKFQNRCWTHNLEDLLSAAGLKVSMAFEVRANPSLGKNWGLVKDWKVESRYQQISDNMAKDMYKAVSETPDGVLSWLRILW